jgi:geranylgeranyl diphosphate synthase type I
MTTTPARLETRMREYRPRVDAEMRAVVGDDASGLYAWTRYHLGWEDRDGVPTGRGPGKMLRSTALLLSAEACGGTVEHAVPAAAAVELLHNFSLVHDDIEDDSDTRRGQAALWKLVGLAQGINTGDGMFTLARVALHRLPEAGVDPAVAFSVMEELDGACMRLIEGQYHDIAFETRAGVGRDEYLAMVEGKTSALFAASAAMGSLIAGAPPERVGALREWGRQIGLAFQAVDDLLGIWGDPALTGKPVGDDVAVRKQTFPVIAALASGEAPGLAAAYRRGDDGEPLIAAPDIATLTAEIEASGARATTEALVREHRALADAALAASGLAAEARAPFHEYADLATAREA